jgi:hypothetical protein
MPFELKVDRRILDILVTGTWTLDIAKRAQSEASRIVKQQGLAGILVDLRKADIRFSASQLFELSSSHAELFPAQTRHALLVSAGQGKQLQADLKFSEDVAVNRGVTQRTFTDPEEARRWLSGAA